MFKFTTLAAFMATSAFAEEKCLLPVDVMILQDTTGSFHDDLPNVRRVLPDLVKKILVQNPGSYFGAADFKDKPYRDLGEPKTDDNEADYCFKLASPLTADTDDFCEAYSRMYATAGGDTPEAHYQALANLATDPSVNWRKLSKNFQHELQTMDLKHETGARLIIMSTDANAHNPGDYELYNGSDPDFPPVSDHPPPKFMDKYPDSPASISPDEQCTKYDYPSQEQVLKLLKDAQINVVFLIPHPDKQGMTDYDYAAAVEGEKLWKEFNKKLGQRDSFLQYIKADSSDLEEVVLKAMAEVSDYVCNETTTSTAPPVTTQGTTQATTANPATTTAAPDTTTAATTAPATTTPATTGPATTTAAPTTPATSGSETTKPASTTAAPDHTTTTHSCPCPKPCPTPGPCDCPCPEVIIKLRHRPQKMHFDISNEKSE